MFGMLCTVGCEINFVGLKSGLCGVDHHRIINVDIYSVFGHCMTSGGSQQVAIFQAKRRLTTDSTDEQLVLRLFTTLIYMYRVAQLKWGQQLTTFECAGKIQWFLAIWRTILNITFLHFPRCVSKLLSYLPKTIEFYLCIQMLPK